MLMMLHLIIQDNLFENTLKIKIFPHKKSNLSSTKKIKKLSIISIPLFILTVLMGKLSDSLMGMTHFLGEKCCNFTMLFTNQKRLALFTVIFSKFSPIIKHLLDLELKLLSLNFVKESSEMILVL